MHQYAANSDSSALLEVWKYVTGYSIQNEGGNENYMENKKYRLVSFRHSLTVPVWPVLFTFFSLGTILLLTHNRPMLTTADSL